MRYLQEVHMAIAVKLKGQAGQFRGEEFTPTKWAAADEKARIANKLTQFVLGGFQQASFTRVMYQRLSNMFGHIAHYDIHGFYAAWFADIKCCRDWAEHIAGSWLSGIGDPAFTWSDVEKALIQWAKENRIAEQLDELYRLDTEKKELTLLNTLQRKYAPQTSRSGAEEALPLPVGNSAQQTANYQLSLFEIAADALDGFLP
jgi:hypothetical protein